MFRVQQRHDNKSKIHLAKWAGQRFCWFSWFCLWNDGQVASTKTSSSGCHKSVDVTALLPLSFSDVVAAAARRRNFSTRLIVDVVSSVWGRLQSTLTSDVKWCWMKSGLVDDRRREWPSLTAAAAVAGLALDADDFVNLSTLLSQCFTLQLLTLSFFAVDVSSLSLSAVRCWLPLFCIKSTRGISGFDVVAEFLRMLTWRLLALTGGALDSSESSRRVLSELQWSAAADVSDNPRQNLAARSRRVIRDTGVCNWSTSFFGGLSSSCSIALTSVDTWLTSWHKLSTCFPSFSTLYFVCVKSSLSSSRLRSRSISAMLYDCKLTSWKEISQPDTQQFNWVPAYVSRCSLSLLVTCQKLFEYTYASYSRRVVKATSRA